MCSGLNNGTDEEQFNKCRFEKARDSVLHSNDRSQCAIRALASFPDSLENERTDTLKEIDKNGQAHALERRSVPMSVQELEQLRLVAIVQCMQALGWADADNWQMGRHNICP